MCAKEDPDRRRLRPAACTRQMLSVQLISTIILFIATHYLYVGSNAPSFKSPFHPTPVSWGYLACGGLLFVLVPAAMVCAVLGGGDTTVIPVVLGAVACWASAVVHRPSMSVVVAAAAVLVAVVRVHVAQSEVKSSDGLGAVQSPLVFSVAVWGAAVLTQARSFITISEEFRTS